MYSTSSCHLRGVISQIQKELTNFVPSFVIPIEPYARKTVMPADTAFRSIATRGIFMLIARHPAKIEAVNRATTTVVWLLLLSGSAVADYIVV